MKKILSLTLALALTFTLASCSGKKDNDKKENDNKTPVSDDKNVDKENNKTDGKFAVNADVVYTNPDLLSLADKLYESFGEDDLPALGSMEISAEDFEYYAFIPHEDGFKAVVSEPMMGSIAHSVVLVETADHETAVSVAENMKTNANPRKWICVEAEKVESGVNGNIAILIMSDSKTDTLMSNFKAVNGETMPVLADNENETEAEKDDEGEKKEENGENATSGSEVTKPVDTKPVDTKPVDTKPADTTKPVDTKPVDTKPVDTKPADTTKPVDTKPTETKPVETKPVESTPSQDKLPEIAEKEEEKVTESVTIDKLYDIADNLYNGINPDDMPFMGNRELTEENFTYSAFVPYNSSYLAVESMAAMGSIPHSVVIVKAQTPEEAAKLAEDMKANANPRKWVCVQARSVKSASKGEYAILVMTSVEIMPDGDTDEDIDKAEALSDTESAKRADLIIQNFKSAI